LRKLALSLQSRDVLPFLAPWWAFALDRLLVRAAWSGRKFARSLNGIADSARFFLSDDLQKAREILQNHRVAWVVRTMRTVWRKIPQPF